MTPEQEILEDLLKQGRSTRAGIGDSLSLLGAFPADEDAFAATGPVQRVASTAMIKQFEQFEDVLSRLIRTTLRALGLRLKGLYPLDIGHRLAELNVLDDPARWLAVVTLRNLLVHEYPAAQVMRFDRVKEAHDALSFLIKTAERLETAIRSHGLLENPS